MNFFPFISFFQLLTIILKDEDHTPSSYPLEFRFQSISRHDMNCGEETYGEKKEEVIMPKRFRLIPLGKDFSR